MYFTRNAENLYFGIRHCAALVKHVSVLSTDLSEDNDDEDVSLEKCEYTHDGEKSKNEVVR